MILRTCHVRFFVVFVTSIDVTSKCDFEILRNEKHQRPSRQDLEPDSSEEALGCHLGHRHVIVFHRQVEASMSAEAQQKKRDSKKSSRFLNGGFLK